MKMEYTFEELALVLEKLLGMVQKLIALSQKFPNYQLHEHKTFYGADHLEESGVLSGTSINRGRPENIQTVDMEEQVEISYF